MRACVFIYRCIYVHIYTHRHTRTYPDGNTHPRVCVCVCLSVVCAHTPVYTGKAQAYRKRGFSVQHRSRRQTPQPPKGKQPPMSEVGRRPEQTPSFQRKVEQTDTQKHKGEHTSTAGLGWAGLGWGSHILLLLPGAGVDFFSCGVSLGCASCFGKFSVRSDLCNSGHDF